MKKLFSKTVAVVLSAACVGSLLTASFDGKPLFVQERIVHAANADIENFESFDGFVSAGAVGVYDSPSFSVKALKYLNKNDKVTIYESKNGYGKINKSKDEWVNLSCIGYKAMVKSPAVDVLDGSGRYLRKLSVGKEVTIYQVFNGMGRITDTKYNVFHEFGTMMPYTYSGEWIFIDAVIKITNSSSDGNNNSSNSNSSYDIENTDLPCIVMINEPKLYVRSSKKIKNGVDSNVIGQKYQYDFVTVFERQTDSDGILWGRISVDNRPPEWIALVRDDYCNVKTPNEYKVRTDIYECANYGIVRDATRMLSGKEWKLLCNAVQKEAEGVTNIKYKAFIVEVILNRLESSKYPNTIEDVLEEANAFQKSSEYTGENIDSFYVSKVTQDTKQAVIYFLEHQNNFNHFYFFNHGNGFDTNYFGGDDKYFFDPDDKTNVLTRDEIDKIR